MDILPGFKLCRKNLHQYPADKRTCPECRRNSNKTILGCALPPQHKVCSCCGKLKKITNFYKHSKNKLRNDCKECAAVKNKKYAAENKDVLKVKNKEWALNNKLKIKNTKLLKKFGITLEEKEKIFKNQNNSCAICLATENIRSRDWDVDHCHKTGRVRGILCSNCNRALGLFGDDVNVIANAASYLNKHK
jgi:hypothetical protein